jgi:hypothetical protein
MTRVLFISAMLISSFSVIASSGAAWSGEHHLNIYGAYVFDDQVMNSVNSTDYFDGTIKGGLQYGVGLEFFPKKTFGVELLWIGQTTTAPFTYQNSTMPASQSDTLDFKLNFAMAGFSGYKRLPDSKVDLHGGIIAGALFVSGKNSDIGYDNNAVNFALGLRGGGDFWLSQRTAIKIQAQLLSGVQSAGILLDAYSTMYQFSIGGGLTFRIGEIKESE